MLSTRLQNQKLTKTTFRRAEQVVSWLGAVQAQDYQGAQWAVAVRATGLTEAAVEEAFTAGRILRTHVLRPTWHFVTPADIRWMVALTAPRIHRVNRGYGRRLGLDDRLFGRARTVIERALSGGTFLTRRELQAALRKARIAVAGQALAHVVIDAELEGIVCSGPRRGREFTYALLAERAPLARVLPREEALSELASRYFQSHGPATVKDFSWWSGLTMTDARVGVSMARCDVLAAPPALERVRGATFLLPNYDEYVIAYKDRGAVIDPERARNLGQLSRFEYPHQVIVDGRVHGSWRRRIGDTLLQADVKVHEPLEARQLKALGTETDRYGLFLQRPARIAFAT